MTTGHSWQVMKKELYIGGKATTDNRIEYNEENLSLIVGSGFDIIKNGIYKLRWDGKNTLYTTDGEDIFWQMTIPVNTEIVSFFYNTAKTTSGAPFSNWILNESNEPKYLYLTSYGDLLVIEDWTQPYYSKIFWSSNRHYLSQQGYVFTQKPNFNTGTATYNLGMVINGKKFSATDKTTWAYNLFDGRLTGYDSYIKVQAGSKLLADKLIYRLVGSRSWYNALYLTNNDLQMVTYNNSALSASASTTEFATNRATVTWKLSHILAKKGDTTTKLSGCQSLYITPVGDFIISGGGTSVIYTLATGLKTADSIHVTTIGDMIVMDSSLNIIWSFFASLVTGIIAKKIIADTSISTNIAAAAVITGVAQPKLADAGKSYALTISKVTYNCGSDVVDATGWFMKDIATNVKKTGDMATYGKSAWGRFATFVSCSGKRNTLIIKWTFNGVVKEKTFSQDAYIDLSFPTVCVGDYGACVSGKKTWVKKYDPYPTSSCEVLKPLDCAVASTPDPAPKAPIDCVGSWSEFGDCVDKKQTATYTVTTAVVGTGKACKAADKDTKSQDCSIPWYTNPLIVGGIGVGILFLFVVIFMFMKSSTPSV